MSQSETSPATRRENPTMARTGHSSTGDEPMPKDRAARPTKQKGPMGSVNVDDSRLTSQASQTNARVDEPATPLMVKGAATTDGPGGGRPATMLGGASLMVARQAAIEILARQMSDNPARYALGLTTALGRETVLERRSGVVRRIRTFITEVDKGEVVPGSALDQWRSSASKLSLSGDEPETLQRLRDLTLPLGQAALIVERAAHTRGAGLRSDGPIAAQTTGRLSSEAARPAGQPPVPLEGTAAAGGQGRQGTRKEEWQVPVALWLDPRQPERSKTDIAATAASVDDASFRRLYRATLAAARTPATDLAAEMRKTGYDRAASELAQLARVRGLALDHVESDAAKRRARTAERGR